MTKQRIRGANIVLVGLNRGAISDDAGYFQINNLYPAPYTVEVSFMGYASQTQAVLVKADETKVSLQGLEVFFKNKQFNEFTDTFS